MKKRFLSLGLVLVLSLGLVACGKKEEVANDNVEAEVVDETATEEVYDCIYDPHDYITLGQYKDIEVTLTGTEYEFTQEGYENYLARRVSSVFGYIEDETQTEVLEDSIVNVDYVGSQDGVAFQGGSAEDVTIDVAANGDVSGTSYIEGFTSGLAGHSVGEEVAYEVTFPAAYGNADLAGQTVIFTFQINYIAKEATVDNITDAEVAAQFPEYANVGEFKEAMVDEYNKYCAANLEADTEDAVVATIFENATINGYPEGYVKARVAKTVANMEANVAGYGYSLADYLSMYGQTVDDYKAQLEESYIVAIQQQMLFEVIADAEGITIDEKEFSEFAESVYTEYGFTDAETFFETNSTGNLDGKTSFQTYYLALQAMKLCVDSAVVNY